MSVARPGSTLPLTSKPEEGCIVWRSICSTSHSKIPKWFACGTLEWTTRGWNQYLARSIQSCRRKLFHELEGWIIVWLRNKKDVMKWTFIHPRISKALGYYWRCTCLLEFEWTRMGKIGQEEKKRTGGGKEWGRKGRGGELRFGGQTNKQTTHRFSAALRRSWGNPLASTIRLHSSPLMLKTLLAGGSPSSPSTAPPTSPSSSLVNSIPRTSPGDGASEVNHYQRLVIILLEEVRAGLPLRETDKRSGLRIQKLSACLHEDRTLNASSWML